MRIAIRESLSEIRDFPRRIGQASRESGRLVKAAIGHRRMAGLAIPPLISELSLQGRDFSGQTGIVFVESS
jgi:hypothetical protein